MSDQKICPTCGTEYPLSERFCPRDGSALRAANAQADLLGAIIADRYHILKKLGEGGMGTVYLAEHVKMGRKSALKVMNPGMNTDPDAIARFNREASNASRLSHPNICGIYDFGETQDGMIYLAMEFIEGSSLTSLIETAGALPAPRAAQIIHQTADALQVAHDAGIVHRDLKPDNIMIARARDGSDQVKVVDFGIAKASSSDAQKVTKTGLVVGTPEYMSPEQLAGDKLDGRSDIYSLGLVAFNCLTGALPFPAESAQEAMIMRLTDAPKTLAEVKGDVEWPAALQATLDRALARETEQRYQSAAKFGRDFAAAIADMPMTAAAEAGTMVMGAQGTARTRAAATTPMPQTRVSRGSAATVAMDAKGARGAPAAKPVHREGAPPAKRSAAPLVLGGVGGAAAVAVVAWQLGLFGAAGAVTSPPGGSPGDSANRPAAETSKVAPVTSGETGTKGAGAPANGSKAAPPVVPAPQPNGTNPAGTGGRTGGTPTESNGSARGAVADSLQAWLNEAQRDEASPAALQSILRELETLRPGLSGAQLAESWYVELVARAATGDVRACDAARRLLSLSPVESRASIARLQLSQDACK